MNFPFEEQQISKFKSIRTFSKDVNEMDLIWHADKENRVINILEGNGWKFQFDEQLPFEMIDGIDIVIPKGVIHRVIKGKGPLKIKVFKDLT